MTPSAHPHPLTDALGHAPADKRLEVLRRVGQTGSISQAARDAGISYKAAWQAIETLSNLSGLTLVDRSVGGTGGGGARITPQGLQLLALADELAQARAQVLARFGQAQPGGLTGSAGLGLRTSMRNQLPCTVVAVEALEQGPMVSVRLNTAGGQVLMSLVTRESADLLGLAPGLPVLALCKATAVAVTPFAPGDTDANPCVVCGVVADISDGAGSQEVALSLPGGSLWIGFAASTAGLSVGQAASGRFAPSALVLGLSG
jgi:molybdate transport system regulatory protein